MKRDVLDPPQKVMRINREAALYGTLAELGAGQGVARWFCQPASRPSAIAKTVSTNDRGLGDAMYGAVDESARRKRLEAILDQEFNLLTDHLTPRRGRPTAFFVFANTVASAPAASSDALDCWMGIRVQTRPLAKPSQILLHARLFGGGQEPEAVLGVLGVNLIYGARYFHRDAETLLVSLRDHLVNERFEMDLVEFSGPDFPDVDNRLMALKLIEHGLGAAATGKAAGADVPPQTADLVRNRPLPGDADKLPPRRGTRAIRGGLIDSLHLAGIPKAA